MLVLCSAGLLFSCGAQDGDEPTASAPTMSATATGLPTAGMPTAAVSSTGAPAASVPTQAGPLTLSSPAIANVAGCSDATVSTCPVIPDTYASYTSGANISPPLSFGGVPVGTRSFAITLRDVTFGQAHWALWNIPATLSELPADIPKTSTMPLVPMGAQQSNATFADGDGYFGPQAPCNVYEFELFALSLDLFTPTQPQYVTLVRAELEALGDAVLARATLTARTNQSLMCD